MLPIKGNPLTGYSLKGQAAKFEEMAIEAKPLLSDLCLTGQATIWYAPPNAGKTLIGLKLLVDAIDAGRVNPANVYYINADDSSEGLATKMHLLDALGAHTLAPGHKGFKAENLTSLFHEMAQREKAQGSLIIIDTVKKVTNLMDKGKASAFA